MGSSTSKGNISVFMLVIALLVIAILVVILAELMISNGVRSGKYSNPNVATHVVRGTIYDRNGRVLALEVPRTAVLVRKDSPNTETIAQIVAISANTTPDEILRIIDSSSDSFVQIASNLETDAVGTISSNLEKNSVPEIDVSFRKDYVRTYPATYHAAQLLYETEKVFDKVLSPNPGFDELTTYGNDVHLTMDLDIQYILDQAIQQVFEIQSPDYAVGLIVDTKTGGVLAATTSPFFDVNEASSIPEAQKVNRALIGSIAKPNLRIAEVRTLLDVTTHAQGLSIDGYETDGNYTKDLEIIKQMFIAPDGNTSLVSTIPDEESKYLVFIGSVNARFYNEMPYVLDSALMLIEQGLAAQNKI